MGVQNVREVPRCEYSVALQTVKLWDDYKTMKAIKAKGGAPPCLNERFTRPTGTSCTSSNT